MSSSNNNSTVVFSVDATGVEAGVNKIKAGSATVNAAMDAMAKKSQLVDAAMKEAAANGFELNARAANKLASEYQRLADTAGKTQAQIVAQKAANTGVTSTFASMQAQIAAASAETHGFSFATSAAKRELVVLAHELSQGNYKKFGGSLLVEAERTGAAGLLFSAAGLGAIALTAAVAGLAYEIAKGAMAFDALSKASAVTGQYLGLTDSQLSDMAKTLAGTATGITTVETTMSGLIDSGRIAADQLSLATKVTADFAHDTGMAAEDAVKAMVKFAEDPKKALEELQSQYHTFSGAQVEVIDGYIRTGDSAAAYKAILQGMDEAHTRMAKTGVDQVGVLQKAWQLLKADVIDTINHISQIGVATSDADKYTAAINAQTEAQANLNKAKAFPTGFNGQNIKVAQAALDVANAQLKAQQQTQDLAQKNATDNKARASSGDAAMASNAYQAANKHPSAIRVRDAAIDEENAAFNKVALSSLDKSGTAYQQDLQQHLDAITKINEDYAKKTKAHGTTSGIGSQLADLMGQNKLIEQEEKRSEQTLKAQRDAGLVDSAQYLQQLHDLQAGALTKEIALAQQRADVAGGKKDKATQQTALAQVAEYNAQLVALDQTLSQDLAKVSAVREGNVRKYADSEAATLQKQQAGYANAFATRFLSADQKSDFDARAKLLENYENQVAALKQKFEGPTADKIELARELDIAQEGYKDKQAALETNLKQQQDMRNSYGDQVKLAMTNLAGASQTNAQLAAQAFTTSFSDMSNALQTFVTTGKISFSGLAASILSDLAKIALQAAESQIFRAAMSSSMFSTGGAVGSYADGGSIVGAGTGTSDSIPAMLSNGEYVLNAASTKKYGSLLDAMNNGTAHFASGGAVGTVAPSSGGSNTNLSLSLGAGNSGLTQQDLIAIAPHIQTLIDKRMAQKIGGQGGFADMIRQGKI
jgi:lambda family phage tail tape measure protein